MHFFWTVIVGFFVGLVAKFLMPGRDGGGFIMTTLLGIAGAVVAKYAGVAMVSPFSFAPSRLCVLALIAEPAQRL